MPKPGLAILIGKALGKPDKTDKSEPEMEKDDSGESDKHEQLMMIAEDLISAVHDKDAGAVAELLQEAFECMNEKY